MSSRSEHRLHHGWLVIAALAIATAPLCWQWIDSASDARMDTVPAQHPGFSVLPLAALQFLNNQKLLGQIERLPQGASDVPAVTADEASSALDLKRVFDDHIRSTDPRERRIAVRAFNACVPAFLPSSGEAPSPEPLIAALPSEHRAEREAAYRALFARCSRLAADGRAALMATSGALQSDPHNEPPGRSAQEAVLAGRVDRADRLVSEALNRAEPAAVASLAGIAARLVSLREPDDARTARLQRAQEIDAALPLVACDLGLDCGEQSLWALELCAAEALCEGDVAARLVERNSTRTIDASGVQKQRLRLLSLLRSGHILGNDDLLAP